MNANTELSATGTTAGTAGKFQIEPIVVGAAAGNFETEASALVQAGLALRQRLAEIGPAWGDDAVGTRFGKQYETPALTVLDNVESLSVGLLRIAAALRAVSSAYVRGEDDLLVAIDETKAAAAAPAVPVGSGVAP